MTDFLTGIRERVGEENLSESCSRDGCEVSLTEISEDRIIVDVDLAYPAHAKKGKRCDFVLFVQTGRRSLLVTPLELKSGNFDPGEVFKQLRAGAKFAEELAPKNAAPFCRPVLVHGRQLGTWQRKKLNEAKIPFRGRSLTVATTRCGVSGNLASVLEEACVRK